MIRRGGSREAKRRGSPTARPLELPIGASCVDVLGRLIRELTLEGATFNLIEHQVDDANWREKYRSTEDRFAHIDEGLRQERPTQHFSASGRNFASTVDGARIRSGMALSLCSAFSYGESTRHLAIMNLHPDAELSRADVVTALQAVTGGIGGYLLETGRYYHFYGRATLSNEEWLKFLAQFLMPTFMVSPRYIGHSLFRGYCTVRLTARPPVKPLVPRLVHVFPALEIAHG